MPIPYERIEQTMQRYREREPQRQQHLEQLQAGHLLTTDAPKRVEQRLERLSHNPIAATAIIEASTKTAERPATSVLSDTEFNRLVQEQVIGQNDWMGLAYLKFALQAAHSVGRIVIRNSRLRPLGYGTGFMVSPRLLLTNNHVLADPSDAQFSLVEFNYQSDTQGQILQPYAFTLDPASFFLTHNPLDFTLVAVQPEHSEVMLEQFGWNRLIEEQGKVILGEYVNIIQHPGGKPKQIALRENRLIDLFDDFLHYITDTAYGSSGSPVLNDQWEVVGLHHSGVPERDAAGNILTLDGQIWTPAAGEERIAWKANEGTRISSIVQHIKRQKLSATQRRFRDEMFTALPPSPLRQPLTQERPMPQSQPASNSHPTINQDGSITWTIPLQISVQLGASPTVSVPPMAQPGDRPTDIPPGEGSLPDFSANPDLAEALERLEQARRGEIAYYDADADRCDRDRYYGKLIDDANNLSRKELFRALKDLVRRTHAHTLSYNPKSRLYPWVDLQPDFTLRSIYSQLVFAPEEIIREDYKIEQERQARLQELMRLESDSATVLEQLDVLERRFPYNCEHVVPQSWFDRRQPMRGDLHHLFTCEVECNSFRGNFPYFDFVDFGEALRTNCGKSEHGDRKFEPENGKGEVARATFYFLLRYPGLINASNNEYTDERLDILLDWHRQFPVTEHENHRNAAIFQKQGNRNPLIDFPEWGAQIDWRLGLG